MQDKADAARMQEAPTLPPEVRRADGEAVTLPPSGESAASGDAGWPSIPDYEILAELGRGGMGVVYKARHLGLHRLVALKMVRGDIFAGEAQLNRFRGEAEALARLQHPNVVQVYEVGQVRGQPFFALEFAAGGSLADKLDGTPLPPYSAALLVETLARAMHAAHQQHIIHRDLKPGNILLQGVRGEGSGVSIPLTPDPSPLTPKITDFGLAKRLDEAGSHTQSGAVMGTPSYMAPEQAGANKEVGPAADIYALGAILYELLTGRPPFRAATPLDTLMQVVKDDPVPPSQLHSRTPRDLETICLKCLQKDPGKRYASAEALAEDLHSFHQGEPILARPVGFIERAIKWARRRPAVAALLVTLVLVLAGGFAGMSALYLQAEAARELADHGEKNADLARRDAEAKKTQALNAQALAVTRKTQAEEASRQAQEQLLRAETARYAIQLDLAQRELRDSNVVLAKKLLSDCRWDFRGWEHRFLWTLCERKLRLYPLWGARGAALSPDGTRIASIHPGRFEIHLLSTAHPLHSVMLPYQPTCITYSQDGRKLAIAGAIAAIKLDGLLDVSSKTPTGDPWVWDTVKGVRVRSYKGHTGAVWCVALSPDGTRMASGSSDKTVKVWDVESSARLWDFGGFTSPVKSVVFTPDGKGLAAASAGFDDSKAGLDRLPGEVKVWDLSSGKQTWKLAGHSCVAISPDGKLLAAAWGDFEAKLWDLATGRETVPRLIHEGSVTSLVFTGDGKQLICGNNRGGLKLWDALTGQEQGGLGGVDPLRVMETSIRSLSLTHDGKRLAAASKYFSEHEVMLWEMGPITEPRTLSGHHGFVSWIAYSPDGKRLASAGGLYDDENKKWLGSEIKIWDLAKGRLERSLKGHAYRANRLTFSPDGRRLASASHAIGKAATEITLWDLARGVQLGSFADDGQEFQDLAFSPDGQSLAVVQQEPWSKKQPRTSSLVLRDAASGKILRTYFKGDDFQIGGVAFSPDGKLLACGVPEALGHGVSVLLWDVPSAQIRKKLTHPGQSSSVFSLAFSRDGTRLAAATGTEAVVWDLSSGSVRARLTGHLQGVTAVAFSRDGNRLATSSNDKSVKIWDLTTGQEVLTLKGSVSAVSCAAFSPDGQTLAASGLRFDPRAQPSLVGEVKLWEAGAGLERTIPNYLGISTYSRDGKQLAQWAYDTVSIWDLITGRRKDFPLRAEGLTQADKKEVSASFRGEELVFSPTENRLAALASYRLHNQMHKQFRFWDVAADKLLWETSGEEHRLAISPDGKLLASAGYPRQNARPEETAYTLRIRDAESGKLVRQIKGYQRDALGLAFSPDSGRLASVYWDDKVVLSDLQTGEQRTLLTRPGWRFLRAVFSADGNRLFIAGWPADDKALDAQSPAVYVHDAFSGKELQVWERSRGLGEYLRAPRGDPHTMLLLNPNGAFLALANSDGVNVWNTRTGKIVYKSGFLAGQCDALHFEPDGKTLTAYVGNGNEGRFLRWTLPLEPGHPMRP